MPRSAPAGKKKVGQMEFSSLQSKVDGLLKSQYELVDFIARSLHTHAHTVIHALARKQSNCAVMESIWHRM